MPEANLSDRPAGEGSSRTARVHLFEESDSGTVPMNHSNKGGQPAAESEEERPLIKENTHQLSTHSTQCAARVSQGLAGVRKAARERKEMKFTALLHHLTVALLRDGFYALKRREGCTFRNRMAGSITGGFTGRRSIRRCVNWIDRWPAGPIGNTRSCAGICAGRRIGLRASRDVIRSCGRTGR